MAVLPIRRYGDPVLREPTKPVTEFNEELWKLINDMTDTMYAAPGVGLAANQVGISKQLMIIDLSVGEEEGQLHVFANPRIVETDGEQSDDEGCLSIPDFTEIVTRAMHVRIAYQDERGVAREMVGEGLMARAMLHEVDHLRGNLYVDHLRGLKKERILKRVHKLMKSGEWG